MAWGQMGQKPTSKHSYSPTTSSNAHQCRVKTNHRVEKKCARFEFKIHDSPFSKPILVFSLPRCPELLVLGMHTYPVADKLIRGGLGVGVDELLGNLNVRDCNGTDDTLNLSNRDKVRTNNLVKKDL